MHSTTRRIGRYDIEYKAFDLVDIRTPIAVIWFFAGEILFLLQGASNHKYIGPEHHQHLNPNHHTFSGGGYWYLVVWLGPYVLLLLVKMLFLLVKHPPKSPVKVTRVTTQQLEAEKLYRLQVLYEKTRKLEEEVGIR